MCWQIRSSPLPKVQSKGTKPLAQIHLDVCHGVLCKWGLMLVVIIVVVYLFTHSLTHRIILGFTVTTNVKRRHPNIY